MRKNIKQDQSQPEGKVITWFFCSREEMQRALTTAVALSMLSLSGMIVKVLKVKQDIFLKCVLPRISFSSRDEIVLFSKYCRLISNILPITF